MSFAVVSILWSPAMYLSQKYEKADYLCQKADYLSQKADYLSQKSERKRLTI